MDKVKSIIWSREASEKVEQIKAYLREEWSEKEVADFLKKLQKFERRVTYFPKLYPASQKYPHMRKAVITKHQSVVYEVEESLVRIITLLDNRQENSI